MPDLGSPLAARRPLSGRWGVYLLADQMIYRESPGSDRGLTIFGVFVYAHPDTALLQYFWEAGLLYRGTFPGRDQDTIGLAVNQSRVSNQLIGAQNTQNGIRRARSPSSPPRPISSSTTAPR